MSTGSSSTRKKCPSRSPRCRGSFATSATGNTATTARGAGGCSARSTSAVSSRWRRTARCGRWAAGPMRRSGTSPHSSARSPSSLPTSFPPASIRTPQSPRRASPTSRSSRPSRSPLSAASRRSKGYRPAARQNGSVPYGYLFSSAGIAVLTALAATGRSRPRIVGALSFRAAMILNEQPFLVLAWLTLSTLLAVVQDDIATPVGWVALAFTALGAAGQLYVLRVALITTSATERALHDGLGAGWRAAIDTRIARRPSTHLPWVRIVFAPFAVGRRDVERVANLRYGDAGRQNLLDLYRRRARPTDGP